MPRKTDPTPNRTIIIVVIVVLVIISLGLLYWFSTKDDSVVRKIPEKVTVPIQSSKVLDYSNMENDPELRDLIDKRKESRGIGEGIDIIASADESVKIGESTIPMQEIMEKIQLKIGDIVEKDIKTGEAGSAAAIREFGIYVVQPGDNIWNVHFTFLKSYFENKGVPISPRADEPEIRGTSSGVGKILKFSENIVYIYNIDKRALDVDLNMIHPQTKLVIYNMDRVFALLDQIDYERVNRIEFDGETLWVPAED